MNVRLQFVWDVRPAFWSDGEGEEDSNAMSDKAPWWRLEGMAESDCGHSWLVKLVIVMLVFPTLLLTLM